MKKQWLIVILSILSIHINIAQTITDQKTIHWTKIDVVDNQHPTERIFVFEEQSGNGENSGLPFIFLNYELTSETTPDQINITVTPIQTSQLSDIETTTIRNNQIKLSSTYSKRIVSIRKKAFLEIKLFPFLVNQQNTPVCKLDHFSITIDSPQRQYPKPNSLHLKTESESVLNTGKWIKIKTSKTGIYKIPYTKLKSWGFSSPEHVNLFGNGGTMLPKANNEFRHDDLQENAILHHNNAIYFFSQGSVKWNFDYSKDMFIHQIHDYSDDTFYYLSEDNGAGKRIQEDNIKYDSYTHETGSFDSRFFHELEETNLLESGRTWYGEHFDKSQNPDRTIEFQLNEPDPFHPVQIYTSVIARSGVTSHFEISANDSPIQTIAIPSVSLNDYTGSFAKAGIGISKFDINADVNKISLRIEYDAPASTSQGWLNFVCVNAKEKISMKNKDVLSFRNKDVTENSNITKFNITNSPSSLQVWNVTNYTTPLKLSVTLNENVASFISPTDDLKEFIAFNLEGSFSEPEYVEQVNNQNLHGLNVPEMLIISHSDFLDEANRLATIHFEHSGLTSEVVVPEMIYNEFSSGKPDVSAIRDFIKYMYHKNDNLKYLLLFGDGSYDNRSNDSDNTNKLLTYQSINSINVKDSYSTDDFFGFLDDNEGENIQFNKLDIGIGRLCVNTIDEATAVVNKIETYLNNQDAGDWRTQITYVADDGDNNVHMRDADLLTQKVNADHPEFYLNKVYLDAYQKVTTAGGTRYPEVNNAINQAIREGTLIFNYTGHGGENGFAHEKILTIDDINQWTNHDRLALFVTATCEFSRYDNPHFTSAGEHVLLNPNGGAVGLLTTTRIAWSNQNYNINSNLYKYIFEKNENGEKLRLGDIIRKTKNASNSTINKLNFTLLGDPAIKLDYPDYEAVTLSLKDIQSNESIDTINALSHVSLKGKIVDAKQNGILLHEGTATIKVFDKPLTIQTIGNDGATPFEYQAYTNRIFTGDVAVIDSTFKVEFIVPKDIRYNVDLGKISFYCSDNSGNYAFGANDTMKIGGISDNPINDTSGPQINCQINNADYIRNMVTGHSPVLSINLSDDSGINTSGVGIGHDITLVMNGDRSSTLVLNEHYTAEKGGFKKGSLEYQLKNLEEGKHTISIKAWDILNNSSTLNMEIEVVQTGHLEITDSSISPNPIVHGAPTTIAFKHNAPNELIQVTTSLYSLDGQLLDRNTQKATSTGTIINPFTYQIPARLSPGIFLIKCECKTYSNQSGQFSKKIVVIK